MVSAQVVRFLNKPESDSRSRIVVIKLENDVVLVSCQTIVASPRSDFGDPQQLGDIPLRKSIDHERRLSNGLVLRLGGRRIIRLFFGANRRKR